MTLAAEPLASEPPRDDGAYDLVLRWLIFSGVSVFAAVALWRYGLVRVMIVSDRTHLSSVIAALYVVASFHCLWRATAVSREAAAVGTLRAAHDPAACALPRGEIGDHVRDLRVMARTRGGGRLDQTLLLRGLAQRLRRGNEMGALASDTLMKLGLLGTIIGFILMLGPVAGLNGEDEEAVRAAMSVMSEGMAVAMYTTLAGLVGSLLVRAQYFMLEAATVATFWEAVRLTETRIAPALERRDV